MADNEASADRLANGTFAPGNPGKAKGTRWRQSRAAELLLEGESEALTRKAIDLAKAGDTTALRLCLERLVPVRKDRTIEFELPNVTTASDHPVALGAILAGVATGEITPAEAQALSAVLEQHRRALETADIDERLRAIEERQNG
ncbi:hypothetical protein [Sphingomonas faeni]|uniref:hypothetical protein n=1 Tax=Sphingomonas faeni TaxID=185950 RepID=UPI0020BD9224|nr:hypothetical protein [Sphingomonas faeni]MCK8457032.1 hypothetical protein [Sphingomonas faeni]